jgi:M6 family metalloprotease-like protein
MNRNDSVWRIPTADILALRVIFTVLILLGLSLTCRAQDSGTEVGSESLESLTLRLVDLNAQRSAGAQSNSQLLGELQTVAATRQQVLAALAESNPGEVLKVSLPANLRGTFPSSVQAFLEQHVDAEGILEVAVEDRNQESRLHFFLQSGGERLTLNFATNPPVHLLTGSRVRVHGIRAGSALALSSGTSTTSLQSVAAATLASTLGTFNTLVIMVNFQDQPSAQPFTSAAVQNVVFNQTSAWDLENSFQNTRLTGSVAGWFTIGVNSTSCDTGTIKTDAQAAAQSAGYILANYNRFIYLMSSNSGCSAWWGWATIGGSDVWINGMYQFTAHVVAHEMGHNFGLNHSHTVDCGTSVICGSGTLSEYGDWIDVMGAPSYTQAGHFDSFQKERLGWLNSGSEPPITTVTSSGTYQIGPYEAQNSTVKALKILQSGSSSSYYYVEYRQSVGFDSFLSGYSDILGGLVVHSASTSNSNSSDLLDMTPSSPSSFSHPALVVGQSYKDPTSGVTITAISASSTGATVQVTFGMSTCSEANPSVSISPLQSQYVTSGTPVNFTVSVKNNDSAACAAATFNLSDTLPSGWTGLWNTSALTLSAGASGSATLTATSPAGTVNGFYNIGARATNTSTTSYTSSASATYVIATPAPLSTKVSTNQSSYNPGQVVYVSVTLLSGSSPDVGAIVNVNITKSNGTVVSLSGTTGSNGVAVLTYRLKKWDTAGTYSVTASVPSTGSSATVAASTTFAVL